MSALEEFLTEVTPEPATDEERDRFVIDGPNTAEWALRKLTRARRKIADARALADAERARIDEWLDAETTRIGRDEAYFVGLLQDWHYRTLTDDPDAKTIRLPAGTLKARKSPDTVHVEELDRFLEWAREARPELVRVKVEPDKPAIRKLARVAPIADGVARAVDPDTGEPMPGITLVEGDVQFSVDTEGTGR